MLENYYFCNLVLRLFSWKITKITLIFIGICGLVDSGILTGFQASPSRPLIIVVQTLLFYVLGLLICCWCERISLWKYKTLQLVSISYVVFSSHYTGKTF